MAGEHALPGDVHGWGTCMAGGCAWLGDMHGWGTYMAGGCAWLEDMHGLVGVHGWVMCMAVERHAWLGWHVWLGVGVHCWGGGHVWVKEDCARFGATPPAIRLASGRYTSYWNADMLIYDVTNEIFINVSTEFLYLTRSGYFILQFDCHAQFFLKFHRLGVC